MAGQSIKSRAVSPGFGEQSARSCQPASPHFCLTGAFANVNEGTFASKVDGGSIQPCDAKPLRGTAMRQSPGRACRMLLIH